MNYIVNVSDTFKVCVVDEDDTQHFFVCENTEMLKMLLI